MEFNELPLSDEVLAAVAALGLTTPTPVQTLVIPPAVDGLDVLGGSPTGTGKSLAFLLPLMERLLSREGTGVRAVILEPTRELALQIAETAQKLFAPSGKLSAGTIVGGASREDQRAQLPDLVVATPGRFNEFLDKAWLDPHTVELLVIDEADRLLDLGFQDEVAAITRALEWRFQTLLFSATLEGAGIRDFAEQVLNDPFEVRLGSGGEESAKLPERLQARAYFVRSPDRKPDLLLKLLTSAPGRTLIFVRTREQVGGLLRTLRSARFEAVGLQGDLAQAERLKALHRFSSGEAALLVATDVAARGLDIPGIERVVNYDFPRDVVTYVHRAGRTARAGAAGVVISLLIAPDLAALERVERYSGVRVERRQIKELSAPFPERNRPAAPIRTAAKPDPRHEERKPHRKVRLRDKRNKGKPDFEQKRLRKAARTKE